MNIRTIHPAPDGLTATIYCEDESGYRFGITIRRENLPSPHQATWDAALAYLASAILQPDESVCGIGLERKAQLVVASTEEQIIEGEPQQVPVAWRDEITAAVAVKTSQGERSQVASSEAMAAELRDAFIALWDHLAGLSREQMESLA